MPFKNSIMLMGAFVDSGLNKKHHRLATRCADYLHDSGWKKTQEKLCSSDGKLNLGEISESAYSELKIIGIIPTSFFFDMYWRWSLMPFLMDLIKRWFIDGVLEDNPD